MSAASVPFLQVVGLPACLTPQLRHQRHQPEASPYPPKAPGVQDYTVLVGYGTPAQQFPMGLETSFGLSLLRCKPCAPGASSCDPAFDIRMSSTFRFVECGSSQCRSNCSSPGVCPLPKPSLSGVVAQDVLTLTKGLLTRVPLRRRQPAKYGARGVRYAPLVLNPDFRNMYFIELVGMSLGSKDIPIPPYVNTANTTAIDVVAKFTHLNPAVYAPLRDAFREEMKEYATAAPFHGLDTCYNFTGLQEIAMPLVRFKFGNGESFLLGGEQMLYFEDPTVGPFSVACLAFTSFPGEIRFSVIGTLAQTTTEVVYDVYAWGKVGFIREIC
ncbi:hypothetical protein QOZ80_6AG0518760 [Eleusine coracana subsp. coracana]|nr:hypothetical protein QOZ80_6AG0518760 [Eleusine coracana subsp. coracana]